jgi:hypothetical protein
VTIVETTITYGLTIDTLRRHVKCNADLRGLSETKCQLSHNSLKINVPGGIK